MSFTFLAISFLSVPFLVRSGSPPTISEHPLDLLVARGDPATLRCETTGENVEVTWYKDAEPVKVGNGHRLLLPNGSLFLLRVNNGGTDSDAGSYYCVARNEYGEVRSQEANVRVAMLRDDFRINPHPVQSTIGNRVILDCTPPKGFPEPIISWRKDEKDLDIQQEEDKFHLSPDGSLIIENAQKSDAGFYQCIAKNIVGERVSKPARLSVYEKPKFIVEPKDVVAEVNSSVLFECRVYGEPMPSISWKKQEGQMPTERAYVSRDRGGLRIDRVQPEDAGEYVCYAKNPVGNIQSSAQLRVNSPPMFTKKPKNLRVDQGKTAIFECEAIGQPAPGIFWSKEGNQSFTAFSGLISSDGRSHVTNEGRLIIENVRPYDQGNYTCAAVNAAGSSLAKATLVIKSDASSSFPPPIIQYGHQNQTLMLNDMAILPCQATGRVSVQISWLKDGRELDLESSENKGRYRQLSIGTLQISDLKKEDAGVYTCKAKNEDGETTWTASLMVEEHTNKGTVFQRMPDAAALPSPPGQPRVLNASDTTIELEWNAPERQGASPVISYIIQYWSPETGESWQNVFDVVTRTRFHVKHLHPENSYVFVIRAENSKGIGLPSPVSEMATTKAAEPTNDGREQRTNRMLDVELARQRLSSEQLVKLVEVRPLNSTAMFLSWKRQRKEPLVHGYYIKWRGPPLAHDSSWVNITDPDVDHVIINGLRPFNNYEFFIIPYHQQVQGMPSNSLDGTTAEAPPTMPPSEIRLRMLNVTSLRVSWRPPPTDHINGILKGFLINIRSNHSSIEDRNITTNERATSVTLYRLIPNASYAIKVAARTNAGVGVFHSAEPVIMNPDTLQRHIRQFERADNIWYRQPWAVLGCGIVLWCFLLLALVALWYRCCHRGQGADSRKKEREFIKIRDGSVCAQTVLGEAQNAFWAAHEHYNGGTVETFSGTLARAAGGQPHFGHAHSHRGNYSAEYGGNNPMNGISNQHAAIHCSATLQRGSECDHHHNTHSPNHYHYAHLSTENFDPSNPQTLSTFLQQRPSPQYYDDPSPYATTTLINPMGTVGKTQRGPKLPSNPAPKEPPSNFLFSQAVMRTYIDEKQCENNPTSNSCSKLLEIAPEQRITAGTFQPRKQKSRIHQQQLQQRQHFGTTGRSSTRSEANRRSSSATTNSRQHILYGSSRVRRNGQEQDSPQTDVSYIQSSDGTNSSSSKKQQSFTYVQEEAPEYDPVMTESMHQQLNARKRRGREKRQNMRNRVSLIEDEEQAEQDPLMQSDCVGQDEGCLEADGEMSEQSDEDEYVSKGSGGRSRRDNPPQAIDKEHYYDFSPASNTNRPSRQPAMGLAAVNVSTLTVGENFHGKGKAAV